MQLTKNTVNSNRRHGVLIFPLLIMLLLSLFVFNGAGTALAKKDKESASGGFSGSGVAAQGGYTGPGPALVTVKQALSMSDDSPVALKGNITQSLGGEDYMFRDASGSVKVEIDHKAWMGQSVGAEDLVILHGEVDKEWTGTKIDVKRVIKQQ